MRRRVEKKQRNRSIGLSTSFYDVRVYVVYVIRYTPNQPEIKYANLVSIIQDCSTEHYPFDGQAEDFS